MPTFLKRHHYFKLNMRKIDLLCSAFLFLFVPFQPMTLQPASWSLGTVASVFFGVA